jgi:hypothetical protein
MRTRTYRTTPRSVFRDKGGSVRIDVNPTSTSTAQDADRSSRLNVRLCANVPAEAQASLCALHVLRARIRNLRWLLLNVPSDRPAFISATRNVNSAYSATGCSASVARYAKMD